MDVLYVRVQSELPGVGRWAVFPHRYLYGLPIVVWEFNTVPEFALLRGRSQADVEREIARFRKYGQGCDLAICVSNALAEYVREKLGIPRVLIVPNGSDPELFRPDTPRVRRVRSDPGCLNVVWMGSAHIPWHDLDLLRETAQLLWQNERQSQIVFHVIGHGLELIPDMPPNVHCHGAKRYQMLPRWLAAMDVGLLLYRSGPADYGSPLKLFDYMASGLTVVGTTQPQLREVFEQLGQPDLLVPRDNPTALADVLLGLAADRERVRRQGALGRQLVIDHYNWRRAVRDILSEIEFIHGGTEACRPRRAARSATGISDAVSNAT